jgi:uncharacterized membrane protein
MVINNSSSSSSSSSSSGSYRLFYSIYCAQLALLRCCSLYFAVGVWVVTVHMRFDLAMCYNAILATMRSACCCF